MATISRKPTFKAAHAITFLIIRRELRAALAFNIALEPFPSDKNGKRSTQSKFLFTRDPHTLILTPASAHLWPHASGDGSFDRK